MSDRSDRRALGWVGLLAGLAVVVSIGTPLIGLRVFHASDVLQLYAPWHDSSAVETKPVNGQITDTVDSVVPVRAELHRRVLDGDLPLWDPYPNGGTPLVSVPHSGGLSPLTLPYLILPTWYAPAIAKLVEMTVAIGFTFLFLRRVGVGRPAALLGGLIFAFSAFQVVWTNWPQPQVGATIPVLFWATERLLQLRTVRSAIPLALAMAVAMFGGFPSVVGYALVALGVYVLARVVAMRRESVANRVRPLVLMVAAMALGVGITAIQLVPFYNQIKTSELQERAALRGKHLPLRSLLTFAVPDAFGSPVDRVYYLSDNYVEAESFIGATALVLIGIAALGARPWRGRGRRPDDEQKDPAEPAPGLVPGAVVGLWAGASLAVAATYAGGPPLQLIQKLPFLGVNFIGRMRSALGFGLAGIAAIGFDRVWTHGGGWIRAKLRGWPAVLVALGVAAAAVGLWRGYEFADRAGRGAYVLRQAAIPAAATGVALLIILLSGRRGRRSIAVGILPVLVAVECVAFAFPFWPRIPREQFYPRTAAHRFLDERLGHDRFAAENRTMYTGTSSFYGLRSVTGHAFQDPAWSDLLVAADPAVYKASRRVPFFAANAAVAASPILDRLAARYFVAAPTVPVFGAEAPRSFVEDVGALSAGQTRTARLRGVPLRAVVLDVLEPPTRLTSDAWVRADVLASDGRILGRGARRVFPSQKAEPFAIAIVGAERARPSSVRVTLDAARGSLSVATGAGGTPVIDIVRPADDGLRIAYSGVAVVYERTRAFPRIRWAGTAGIVLDRMARVTALKQGFDRNRVLLSDAGPVGSGRAATLDVVEDSGDAVRVRVDAEGDGYLVVADPMQADWKASIDGSPARIRAADHAGVAVNVPAGRHEISFRYRPAGRRTGIILTGVSLVVLLGVIAATSSRWRRRRAPASSDAG